MRIVGIVMVIIGAIAFYMFANEVFEPHDTSRGTDYLIGEYAADAFFGIVGVVLIFAGAKIIKKKY